MNHHRNHTYLTVALLALGMTVFQTVQAQDVQVFSADPPAAEQGTVNLEVTIEGSGFDNSAEVFFLVTGTENPGGIVVNSARARGHKKIIANIDVSETANVSDFDIDVRMSGGRGGKGTTLFRVSSKDNRPLSMIRNTAGWYGSVTEDLNIIDDEWILNDTLDELPRPCTAEWVEPDGGSGWYACGQEGTGGGRVIVDLAGTEWLETDDGRNRPGNTGYCDLLNAWAASDQHLIFGPTRFQYWYNPSNPCPAVGSCELRVHHYSYFTPPTNGNGEYPEGLDLHPFHGLSGLPDGIPDLTDVGVMVFNGFGEGIVQSAVDLNVFVEQQIVAIDHFIMTFWKEGTNKVLVSCETVPGTVNDAWFATDPLIP